MNKFDNIPSELKQLNQWVLWKLEPDKKGKPTKVPYQLNGRKADKTNPNHWASYQDVINKISKTNGSYSGIGFCISKNDPYCVIDLDTCIEGGKLSDWGEDILTTMKSHPEISQSESGIHIFSKAIVPENIIHTIKHKNGKIEVYDQGWYFCMTGNQLPKPFHTLDIAERQTELNSVLEKYGMLKKENDLNRNTENTNSELPDSEILSRIFKAKNGDRFKKLYNGDISDYPTESEADFAIVNFIGYYTKDHQQILNIIRQTPLWDEKWERKDYQKRTIDRALSTMIGTYGDKKNQKKTTPKKSAENIKEKPASNNQETQESPIANDTDKYYENKKFVPYHLAEELKDEHDFIYTNNELYVYKEGVYRPIGVDFIKAKCREKLHKMARINNIKEVIAHIQDTTGIDCNDLNTHKYLINLNNGMYDINESKLIDHDKKYLSTIRIPVLYDRFADCDFVTNYFKTTIPDDCIGLAYELFGYCLIPDTSMRKAFMLAGTGRNGKSKFIDFLSAFVGNENTSTVPLQDLDGHRFKRAELFGKLLNVFADLDSRALESTSYFKSIVSGDPIDGERKGQQPFKFKPFSRMVYSANEIPMSNDKTFAFYDRWVIINFCKVFVGANEDKNIVEKLTKPENLSAMLSLALMGLKTVLKDGAFDAPQSTTETIGEYQKSNDPVSAFVADSCTLAPAEYIERGLLFNEYCTYCSESGYKALTRNAFYQRIRVFREVGETRDSEKRMFKGINIKS